MVPAFVYKFKIICQREIYVIEYAGSTDGHGKNLMPPTSSGRGL
jgi:hypothetical protein